jgi:hypothetical protein
VVELYNIGMDKDALYKKLREPFDVRFVNWKINNYSGDKTKAMITFYLDARAVQHRLNQVLGVEGWSFSFSELDKDQGVHGKLTVYIFTDNPEKPKSKDECIIHEVTREDVGYASTTNKDEWYKDAVSDALKRCAVHFGVGHFLYALPNLWVDLTEPGQKYLNKDQDKYISDWLSEQVSKMSSSPKRQKE